MFSNIPNPKKEINPDSKFKLFGYDIDLTNDVSGMMFLDVMTDKFSEAVEEAEKRREYSIADKLNNLGGMLLSLAQVAYTYSDPLFRNHTSKTLEVIMLKKEELLSKAALYEIPEEVSKIVNFILDYYHITFHNS